MIIFPKFWLTKSIADMTKNGLIFMFAIYFAVKKDY